MLHIVRLLDIIELTYKVRLPHILRQLYIMRLLHKMILAAI